jgi:hypothetical protein
MINQCAKTESVRKSPRLQVICWRALGVVIFSLALWISAEVVAPTWAHANLPVIDTTAVGQMIAQYAQMARQLETMYQQVTLLQQQIQSVTGHYGMGAQGSVVNPWGVTTWVDIADMVSKGFNPGDGAQVQAYKQAQARYSTQFPELSGSLQTGNPRMNAAYTQSYSDGISGMSLGESAFNQVNSDLADIQALKDRIDQTDNLKSAMDLNTAATIRVAQLNGEILRVHAAELRLQAANRNDGANGSAAQAEFFAQ